MPKILAPAITALDSAFALFAAGDQTKKLAFDLASITTGNTRTLTVPNANGTIALVASTVPDTNGLTEDSTPKILTDCLPFYSSADAAHRKIKPWHLQASRVCWEVGDEFMQLDDAHTGVKAVTSSGGVAVAASERYHPGIVQMHTGTSAAGRAGFFSHTTAVPLGSGKTRFECAIKTDANLSDASNNYTLRFGVLNTTAAGDGSHGVFFRYNHGDIAGKWAGYSRVASTNTILDLGVTVAISTWYNLAFEVNAAANSVEWFLDGVSKGTTGTSPNWNQQNGIHLAIEKTAGTTQRNVYLDYYRLGGEIDSAR